MTRIKTILKNIIVILGCLVILAQSSINSIDFNGQVSVLASGVEFDFIRWTLNALFIKDIQGAVNAPAYMSLADQRRVVLEYLRLVQQVNQSTAEANRIYADPDISNPDDVAAEVNQQLAVLKEMEGRLKPIAESVLQYQVSKVVGELGLSLEGQPIPPVLYHVSRLPNALIISPRDTIRQDANISLIPEMATKEIVGLEDSVENKLNVSALVVPVGGIGTYPSMVMSTTDLNRLAEVVSHEWTHNFLTLRPLGIQYGASGEMRTINETTASIAGKEIGRAVMLRFYPELAPPPPVEGPLPKSDQSPTPVPEEDSGVFNFNREMHKTRVRVDELLAQGKLDEAEQYMESRRRVFWENGYQIRKLNQAYFAFFGAYDDSPEGGAAGQDPIGPTVQELRGISASLTEFLNRISWVSSYDDLLREIQRENAAPASSQ